jgi:hypothetical protein
MVLHNSITARYGVKTDYPCAKFQTSSYSVTRLIEGGTNSSGNMLGVPYKTVVFITLHFSLVLNSILTQAVLFWYKGAQ